MVNSEQTAESGHLYFHFQTKTINLFVRQLNAAAAHHCGFSIIMQAKPELIINLFVVYFLIIVKSTFLVLDPAGVSVARVGMGYCGLVKEEDALSWLAYHTCVMA